MSRSEVAAEVAEITADSVNNAENLKPAEDPYADVQVAAAEAAEAATRQLLSKVQIDGDRPGRRGGWTGSKRRRAAKKRRGGWTGSRKKRRGGWTGSKKKRRGGWTGSKKKRRGGWTGSKKKKRGGWTGSKKKKRGGWTGSKKKRGGWTGSKKKRQLGGGYGGFSGGGYSPYLDDEYDDFDDDIYDDDDDFYEDYGLFDEYLPQKRRNKNQRYAGGAEAYRQRYGYPADYFAGDTGDDGDGAIGHYSPYEGK